MVPPAKTSLAAAACDNARSTAITTTPKPDALALAVVAGFAGLIVAHRRRAN